MIHLISLGAGVQSSTMALMAAHGLLEPMPIGAIFADTGAEPKVVYEWLDFLESKLPFPVYRVAQGDLRADSLEERVSARTGNPYLRALIPAFTETGGLLGRKCTRDYKITPIRRKTKELMGLNRHDRWPEELRVVTWIGISTDEIQRMKVSTEAWQEMRHPLIEERMSRQDCLDWMRAQGYPEPPRSACTFCPFHSDEEWRKLTPEEFADAVKFEKELQELARPAIEAGTLRSLPFLHAKRIPLETVDLNDPVPDQGRLSFMDECEGMCGI